MSSSYFVSNPNVSLQYLRQGFDSKSNQKLPYWISQTSSLSREQILKQAHIFIKYGLDANDYIIETNVTTTSYSDLMKHVLPVPAEGKSQTEEPLLVLVDTEGFDCNVVEGISPDSPFLPKFIVFEHIHCNYAPTNKHLHDMGYNTVKKSCKDCQNTIAIRPDFAEYWPTTQPI
mmetsp:Transcript_131/g.247  ORF Transcript_131/g.247 Transcript_131/m.247 type:complete len:174 (+) Transcript_131:52-573(+)